MEEDRGVDMGKYFLGLDFGTLDARAVWHASWFYFKYQTRRNLSSLD